MARAAKAGALAVAKTAKPARDRVSLFFIVCPPAVWLCTVISDSFYSRAKRPCAGPLIFGRSGAPAPGGGILLSTAIFNHRLATTAGTAGFFSAQSFSAICSMRANPHAVASDHLAR
jgi:hypothetical protein